MTNLVGVAYCSKAVKFSFDKTDSILTSARAHNEVHGITGALIYDDKIFLQWLEGGASDVRALLDNIFQDPRHAEVKILTVRRLEDRLFPDWSMTAAVTQDQTLRGLKLVPHLSVSHFNPFIWADSDVTEFIEALSDHLTRRPAPKSEPLADQIAPQLTASDPMASLDRHLRKIV